MATGLIPAPATTLAPGKRRRWPFACAGVVLLLAFAPALIAHSPILRWIVAAAASDIRGTVTVGSASLGWLSRPELRDVEVRDAQGAMVASIAKVEVERTLVGLLMNRTDLGTINLERPVFHVVVNENGSNIANLLKANEPRRVTTSTPRLRLVCTDGQVFIRDDVRKLALTLNAVQLALNTESAPTLQIDVRAKLGDNDGDLQAVIALTGSRIAAEKLTIAGPIGAADMRGAYDWNRSWEDNLRDANGAFSANVDLAKLAARAPQFLALHNDVQLTEGRLTISCTCTKQADRVAWAVNGTLSAVRGDRAGRALAWLEPMTLNLKFDLGRSGPPRLTLVHGTAAFGQLTGSDEADAFTVRGDLDLDRLAAALGQFCDLGAVRLAGKVDGHATARLSAPGSYLVEGKANVHQLRLHLGGTSLEAATATAQTRVLQTTIRTEAQMLTLSAKDLNIAALGCSMREPTLDLQAAGHWERDQLTFRDASLRCPTLAIETAKLDVDLAKGTAAGKLGLAGWLERLQEWGSTAPATERTPIAGQLQGVIDLQADRKTRFSADLSIKDLRYGPAQAPTWREALVRLVGRGTLDLSGDRLDMDSLQLRSALAACDGKLTCAALTGTRQLNFTGQLSYELATFEPMLKKYLGPGVQLTGKGTRPVRVIGPLAPPGGAPMLAALEGEVGVHWTALKAYPTAATGAQVKRTLPNQAFGCEVGPAEVTAKLGRGAFAVAPILTTFNGGSLRLEPRLRLSPNPMEITVPAGSVLEKVQITPGLCASGLRYALPLLADVAEAEGQLSLALDHAKIPAANPDRANIKGTLVVHTAKVAPGPAIRKLNEVLRVAAPYGTVRESKVPFHMVQGKVHHRDLELVFPDFTLRTSGVVGLDGTMQLVGELTITSKNTASNPILAGLARQTWRIPIQGTMDRPQVDLRGLGAAALSGAAGGLIPADLDQGLKKLLRP